MCNLKCSAATIIIGIILVVGSCVLAFVVVPKVVENIIVQESVLLDDSVQMERFQEVPFPLELSVTVFSISNPEQVLEGEAPDMVEAGPYVYKLHIRRNITSQEEDLLTYRLLERYEFDAETSYPRTEDDVVTIINVPYHGVIQMAESSYPNIMPALNLAMSNVFGQHNSPIMTVRIEDLLFNGIRICANPGLIGGYVCGIIRSMSAQAQNLAEQEDGSLLFSVLGYKATTPSQEFKVYRGIDNHSRLGHIKQFAGLDHLVSWAGGDSGSVCNMLNGTDSGIFAPFVTRDKPLYVLNTDICRSVELRYQHDAEVSDIPVLHFSANEWFLKNGDQCFCLNQTQGINREDGCLLEGAIELYSCVGASLVLTNPHFLYADSMYTNAIHGMAPVEKDHRIFLEIEPNTGTPVEAAKRAQFNIFQRSVPGIPRTGNLRTALVPIFWLQEAFSLPEDFREQLRSSLLERLSLLDIILPTAIALCAAILLLGIIFTVRATMRKKTDSVGKP